VSHLLVPYTWTGEISPFLQRHGPPDGSVPIGALCSNARAAWDTEEVIGEPLRRAQNDDSFLVNCR
jgi:hypothetical protein